MEEGASRLRVRGGLQSKMSFHLETVTGMEEGDIYHIGFEKL